MIITAATLVTEASGFIIDLIDLITSSGENFGVSELS
jgi:hypothetical protein